MRQGIFLPQSTVSADSFVVSVKTPCAIACINICAQVKKPEHWQSPHCLDTRKYCTQWEGGVALLCGCCALRGYDQQNFPHPIIAVVSSSSSSSSSSSNNNNNNKTITNTADTIQRTGTYPDGWGLRVSSQN